MVHIFSKIDKLQLSQLEVLFSPPLEANLPECKAEKEPQVPRNHPQPGIIRKCNRVNKVTFSKN